MQTVVNRCARDITSVMHVLQKSGVVLHYLLFSLRRFAAAVKLR